MFVYFQSDGGIFKHGQIWLLFNDTLHPLRIFEFGTLTARRPNCRSTGKVECLGLQTGGIRISSHFTAKGIQLIDEMTFGKTSNGRVARHPRNGILTRGDEKCLDTHPGGCQSRFSTGVSTADHNDFKLNAIVHTKNYSNRSI